MTKPTPKLPMEAFIEKFKRARNAGTPIFAITCFDPAATMSRLQKSIVNGDAAPPIIQWDIIEGWRHRNQAGQEAIEKTLQETGAGQMETLNPTESLKLALSLPKDARAVVFMMNTHHYFDQDSFLQALWNARDVFKSNLISLVLIGPDFDIPAQLQHDIFLMDEPLPTEEEIKAIIDGVVDGTDASVTREEKNAAVDALRGLSAFPAESSVAMNLRKSGLDVEGLWDIKKKLISATPGLRVYTGPETFTDIGGCDQIKRFMTGVIKGKDAPNVIVFLDEGEKLFAGATGSVGDSSGVAQDQLASMLSYMEDNESDGAIFYGPPGCLSGDTKLFYQRGKERSKHYLSLKKMYQRFNGLPLEGRGRARDWDPQYDTFLHSYNHETGTVFFNKIEAIFASGERPCKLLTLSTGERLRLTSDHPVLTPHGFTHAGDLLPGQVVICRGSMLPQKTNSQAPRAERVTITGLKYYRSGINGDVVDPTSGKRYRYKRQTRARLVLEAELNELTYENYLSALKNDPEALNLKALPENIEVHHKNENSMDDQVENLEVLTKAEHTLSHDPIRQFNVEYTKTAYVISIEDSGVEETFDIQMASPGNNFATADGLIVHNSAKSMVAKSTGNEAGVPTIMFDLGGMKGSLVGKSEAQVRNALKVITAVGGGKAFFLMTCNAIVELPPELRRRFTSGIFFFDLPTAIERATIWPIYLAKYGLNIDGVSFEFDEGWTGAEIRNCCRMAYRQGIPITEAAKYIVPVSQSAGHQITQLRRQASGAYLSANEDGVYRYEIDEAPHAPGPMNRKLTLED